MKRQSTRALVIHTTASHTNSSASDLMRYFLNILRWNRGGYHAIIERDGRLVRLYDYAQMEATNGILPDLAGLGLHNLNCIHIAYVGGISNTNQNEAVCNITAAQESTLKAFIEEVVERYSWIKIVGHNQLNRKWCPSFWVPAWVESKLSHLSYRVISDDVFGIKDKVMSLPHPNGFYLPGSGVCSECGRSLEG